MRKQLRLLFFSSIALSLAATPLSAAEGKPGWQAEWEKTIAAAEKEGQITIYAPPGKQYQDAVTTFSQYYPKIKLTYVPGSGSSNAQKLMAERRAGKELPDVPGWGWSNAQNLMAGRRGGKFLREVFFGGGGTLIEVLFGGKAPEPM